jgi:predicted RNA-binding protein YlqC (UPF0109 family)
MKNFLNYLITNLVKHPDQISIEEQIEDHPMPTQDEEQSSPQQHLILTLNVAEEDMGLVIGKNGKVISSLRTLLKLRNQTTHEYLSVALQLEETPSTSE